MSNKQIKSSMRRLRNGVPIYCKGILGFHKRGTFKVERSIGKYRGIVFLHTDQGDSFVNEVWEVPSIDLLRRIACGYYPSLCKHFGPARNFSGI